jgi:hypothetical protein
MRTHVASGMYRHPVAATCTTEDALLPPNLGLLTQVSHLHGMPGMALFFQLTVAISTGRSVTLAFQEILLRHWLCFFIVTPGRFTRCQRSQDRLVRLARLGLC